MPSTPSSTSIYRRLAADERQEFRLPGLLKAHVARAAEHAGQSVAEYITAALAERVTRDLAASGDWALTVDEQASLMKILVSATPPSARARAAAARADKLFGALPRTRG